jgi:hypothetical protein
LKPENTLHLFIASKRRALTLQYRTVTGAPRRSHLVLQLTEAKLNVVSNKSDINSITALEVAMQLLNIGYKNIQNKP